MTDLTLAKAVEIAHSMEAADHNAQQLKGNDLRVAQVRRRHVQQRPAQAENQETLTTRGSLATVVEGEAMQRGSVVLRMYYVTTVEKRSFGKCLPLRKTQPQERRKSVTAKRN